MLRLLEQSRPEIQAAILQSLGSNGRPDITVKQLQRMMRGVREVVGDKYDAIFDNLERQLTEFAADESRFNLSMLRVAIPAEVLAVVPLESVAPAQVAASALARPFQGMLLREWAEKLGDDLVRTITNTVANGFRNGVPTEKIIADVNLGTAGQNLNAVVRSAVGHFAAEAREITAEANSDIVKCEVWVSTLDGHTSTLCIVRDHLTYRRVGKKMEPIGHNVPWGAGPGRLHFCCRSTSVMMVKKLSEMGLKPEDFDSATRASMNGQVPAGTTFSEWVVGQSAGTLEDVFGVERAHLIRQGKVKVPDLFTDDGRYLTLDQLREHLPE